MGMNPKCKGCQEAKVIMERGIEIGEKFQTLCKQLEAANIALLKTLDMIVKHAPEKGGDWALMKAQAAIIDYEARDIEKLH